MFEKTGCVPGSDGEEVPAETMVPDAKKYILETINDPEAFYDPEIWDTPGFTLVLSWLAQKWQQKCRKLAPRGGNKNAIQYLTKEQQKACLDSAAAELIREITQQRPLNSTPFRLHDSKCRHGSSMSAVFAQPRPKADMHQSANCHRLRQLTLA